MEENEPMTSDSDQSVAPDGRLSRIRRRLTRAPSDDNRTRPRSLFAVAAGWMIVMTGLLTLLNGLRTFMGETSWDFFEVVVDLNKYSFCAILIMAFGVVAIAGGISAIRGKSLFLALAGAALGMVGDGVVGFWLGLAAILFLFLSSGDF